MSIIDQSTSQLIYDCPIRLHCIINEVAMYSKSETKDGKKTLVQLLEEIGSHNTVRDQKWQQQT